MSWLRPALVAFSGLVIAPAAGLAVLPVLVVVDPVTRDVSVALVDRVVELLDEAAFDPSAGEEAGAFLGFLYTAVVAICFLPILFVAALGALAKLRSWTYLAAATGIVTAAMAWTLRYAFHLPRAGAASPAELRLALVLFLTGIVIGSVYWLVSRMLGGGRGDDGS